MKKSYKLSFLIEESHEGYGEPTTLLQMKINELIESMHYTVLEHSCLFTEETLKAMSKQFHDYLKVTD